MEVAATNSDDMTKILDYTWSLTNKDVLTSIDMMD